MILKLSLTVLLLYYLAVLWKYYRQDIAGIFGTAETDEDTDGTGKEPGQPGEPYTVMGESTYWRNVRSHRHRTAAGCWCCVRTWRTRSCRNGSIAGLW